MRATAVAIVLAATAGTARAQQARPLPPGDQLRAAPLQVHRLGVYSGVQPQVAGSDREGQAGAKKRRRRPGRITWVGFQAQGDGGARVFLQLTSEVPYEQRVEKGRLVVHLDGARLGNRNARRFLDTRFFDTALARIDADAVRRRRGRKAGVDLEIRFKSPADAAEAQASMTTSEIDGYTYLFLEIPPTSGSVAGAAEGGDGG